MTKSTKAIETKPYNKNKLRPMSSIPQPLPTKKKTAQPKAKMSEVTKSKVKRPTTAVKAEATKPAKKNEFDDDLEGGDQLLPEMDAKEFLKDVQTKKEVTVPREVKPEISKT
jgi:hypothetical protein